MMKVLVVGGASYDTLIHLNQLPQGISQTIFASSTWHTPGSTGIGKAVAMQKLGMDVSLQIVIGRDIEGRKIEEYLSENHVNSIIDVDSDGTETHVNLMDDQGGRISIYTHPLRTNPSLDISRIQRAMEEADILVMNIIPYVKQFLPYALQLKKPIWVDLHDYDGFSEYHHPFLDVANVVFFSSDQFPTWKSWMLKQKEMGKELIVCTHGKDGADGISSESDMIHVEAFPATVVDSNGAGDHFFAGVMWAIERKYSLQDALLCGALVGAACVESPEISPSTLTETWLLEQLQERRGSR